jgi:hypothetical protein
VLRAGAALLLGVLAACARMGPPAGGPEDKVAPVLLATVPESVGVFERWDREVEFRFDEVISEGGQPSMGLGTGDLEKLILLSPSRGVPVVKWKRDRITVKPREGWKPNRVYRVELLPGIVDLRRNRLDTTTVLTFSTGGPMPTDTLKGIALDWTAGRVARAALLDLVLSPDSLVYRAITDSSGRFAVGPLPRGSYVVYAAIDQNRNLRREPREAYDSALVEPGTTQVAPLWIIPRDTIGPRISQATPNDSVSVTLTFSGPLDPYQPVESLTVRLLTVPDSSPVPVRSLRPKALDDSLQQRERARADSLRQARDTTARDSTRRDRALPPRLPRPPRDSGAPGKPPAPAPGAQAPRPGQAARVDSLADSILATRPKLFDKLVLRVDSAFVPEARYAVEIQGIRSAAGVAGTARTGFVIPKKETPAPADSLQAPADSLRAPADSAPPPNPAPPSP